MASPEPTKYTSKLKGARVLIIGGTSGIGFGVAEAAIEHGASVIVSSSSQDRVSKAVQRLEASYPSAKGRVQGFVCDLATQGTVASEVEKLFAEVTKGGKLDHVVHTAGGALAVGNLEDFTLEQMQQAGNVRFFSPLMVAQHLRKHMNPGPASSYTLTSAGMTHRPRPNWAIEMSYLVGMEGMTRALALDLKPIRVNLVGPGATDTELWDRRSELGGGGNLDEFKAKVGKMLPTGTFGKVEDVAESYIYCMKDKNVTGIKIDTNGGGPLV